jgi:hypothetical protein
MENTIQISKNIVDRISDHILKLKMHFRVIESNPNMFTNFRIIFNIGSIDEEVIKALSILRNKRARY